MIKSMTGFGKGESKGSLGRFTAELRTVNHRYFDLSCRLPNSLSTLEDRIKSHVHKFIKRGKVNFSLLHKKGEKDFNAVRIDEEALARYYRILDRIRKKFKLKEGINLSQLFLFPDVLIQEQPEHDLNSIWPSIEIALEKAIADCNNMREGEGIAIYKDLSKRIEKISSCMGKISQLAPKVVSEYKKKLDSRIKDIVKNRDYELDSKRLEIELAIFARQCDISEEITRAKAHINSLKNELSSKDEAGRRIDFILQELQREINTLGSKASSVEISRLVVDIKSETEKMREQAQNVE